MFLKQLMKENLDYFMSKVDAPIAKTIIFYAKRYPEPTRENCMYANSLRLLDLRDKFRKQWDFGGRQPLFEALWKLLIVKYEQSPQYRYLLDWVLMMIPEDWKPFNLNRQMKCWKGDIND